MLELLDTSLIAPLRWGLLHTLELVHALTKSYGLSLLALSIVFNLLLAPFYHWAERVQANERECRRRLQPKLDEFRHAFKGQELHLMLRQLYKLHGYHPIFALRALAPLVIQVPFFIAAFGLLSHYLPFEGESFLFVRDLSKPDRLLGGENLLPLVMTGVNLYALHLYSRQLPRPEWAQGVVVAVIFLILLYASPSGLVLYWTFNNLISVAKSAWYARNRSTDTPSSSSHFSALRTELLDTLRGPTTQRLLVAFGPSLKSTYFLACACIFLLLAVTLPISFASLEDNVDGLNGYVGYFLRFSMMMAIIFALLCALWYRITGPTVRAWSTVTAFWVVLLALSFSFAHQPDAGMLDNFIFFTPKALAPSTATLVLDSLLALAVTTLALWVSVVHFSWMRNTLIVLLVSCIVGAAFSMMSLNQRIDDLDASQQPTGKLFRFSKTKPNILLIFLDGAMSGFIPAALEEEPDLKERLRGFDWYPNVVSSGNRTINGLPSVFGGIDYTVGGINARNEGSLKDKVTDAYKVYVENFHANNYDVQYADPFWFGLARTGDCNAFNAIYERTGKARCIHAIGSGIDARKRQITASRTQDFFSGLAGQYYAITAFRVAPYSLKHLVYDDGKWLSLSFSWKKKMDKYLNNVLSFDAIPTAAEVDSTRPTFNFITNEATRATFLMNESCLPEDVRGISGNRPHPRFQDVETQKIFETHKCVLRGIAQLMDWLRSEGIFDNTYVVLVSDHGWISDNPLLDGIEGQRVFSMYQAFLMVKDFGSQHALKENRTYIANFNVPGLVCEKIGGCTDKATGKTIRYVPLTPPVALYETPWQPAGQTLNSYVIEATHESRGPVGQPSSWHMTAGQPSKVRPDPTLTSNATDHTEQMQEHP